MPIYKRCTRCGKKLPIGTKCECMKARHKEYDRTSRDSARSAFYKSKEWQILREQAMEMYGGIDIYSYYVLGKIEKADMVHHIVPIEEDWNKRNDIDNLIPNTNSNHEKFHYRMKNGEHDKVIEELLELKERWRRDNNEK